VSDDIAALSAELAADPSSLAFLPLGEALRQRAQLEAALTITRRGLGRHPHHPDGHDLLARIHADRGELDHAFDEWDMVARLSPGHPGALKGLGFVRFQQGRLGEAEQFLSAAAAVDPTDERNLSALAYVRAQRGAQAQGNGGVTSAPVAVSSAAASPSPETPGAMSGSLPGASPPADPARALFADISADGAGIVILIGADGLVMAGESVTHDGRDVAAEVGAAMSGVGEEAGRSMKHLGLGAWTSIVYETDRATVALAPAPADGLVLVAAARTTPLGFVRKMLERAGLAARRFVESA
jgi:predicted regulator of Ras-like GTPase activity (Roadblock/LC7/MglB family)